MPDLTLSLSLWQALLLAGGILGAFLGVGRGLLAQIERRLDDRFAEMERSRTQATLRWSDQFAEINAGARANDQRLTALLAELPLHYQRREDAIRQEVAIIARLDALGGKVAQALECDVRRCPVKEVLKNDCG